MSGLENKKAIRDAIQGFAEKPLREASRHLFAALGYESNRTIPIDSVAAFCGQFDPENKLTHPNAHKDQWKFIHLLFQITDEELSHNTSLFQDTSVKSSLLQSYVFFAIELKGGDYARSKLASITRQLNRIFPMPVMVLFKMVDKITIAVINRRQHKREESKDVLGKVTLIQNISIDKPHPGHLDILTSFSVQELAARKKPIGNFDQLHAAWEEVFNVELLNKRFYEELSNWYFWARRNVSFPADLEPDEEKRNSTSVIRLLTRLIFCWFLKEKGLIPENLFDKDEIAKALISLNEDESTYYRAILQNLFFATLNQQMNAKGKTPRQFADDESFAENRAQYGIKNLYRYKESFRDTAKALALFEDIPFLNGGLFACLDPEDEKGKVRYADGFTRNPKKQPLVPNYLFFAEPQSIDLSKEYGEAKKKKESVRGLLHILRNYKFTITENTPVEQEIALDPELLGKVFENLLASYNPETGTTARKQTGSFYTPRPIVDYMVDESLKAYLAHVMVEKLPGITAPDANAGLDILFAYTEREHAFSGAEIGVLITAIDSCNILDPACGSGAFPMGILHKLVFILGKLDPNNEKWRERQIAKAEEIEDPEARDSAVRAIERDFADNALDYGRKLYLIENCIYGVDIQPIAIQISKLRFFISLVCDQKANRDKAKNHGIRPLPNLETKFVAADSLISLIRKDQKELFANPKVEQLEKELEKIRHRYFSAQTRQQKRSLQLKDAELCRKILTELNQASFADEDASKKIASWNPYDHYAAAGFFNAEWMFGRSLAKGFDVIIGNPPYGAEFSEDHKEYLKKRFDHIVERIRNSFLYFMGASFDLVKPYGIVCFILPNEFLFQIYMTKARRFFLDNAQVMFAINVGEDVFDAIVPTCIVSLKKIASGSEEIPVADLRGHSLEELPDVLRTPLFPKALRKNIRAAPNSIFTFNINSASLVNRLSSQFVAFETFCEDIANGVSTSCDGVYIVPLERTTRESFEEPFCKPCIRGGQFNRFYCPTETEDRLLYVTSDFDAKRGKRVLAYLSEHKDLLVRKCVEKKAGNRAWHILFRPRYAELFRKPKIIIRQTGDSVIAAVDNKVGYYCIDSVNAALVKERYVSKIFFFVGLLNSNLLNFFYREISQEGGRVLAQVKPQRIRVLPIAQGAPEVESTVTMLVMQIVCEKAKDSKIDTTILEREIDEYVYRLYGLTADEIRLVEESAPLRKNI